MSLTHKAGTFFKKLFSNPKQLLLAAGQNGLLNFIPDKDYLEMVFKAETGYKLNLEKPKTYNEKLQWIKLFDRKPEYTIYADKYAVREYIKETIGEEYLIPLIGVYDKADDIIWEKLPNRFVLKCTHGSGTNVICTDKTKLGKEDTLNQLKKYLKRDQFCGGREWCYKDIKPRIVCEEFLDAGDGAAPDDYKFMCFNGEPKLIQLHHDRFGKHTLTYYTPDWKKTELKRIDEDTSDEVAEKPEKLEEMLDIARTLSKNLYFARIDLYLVKSKIYFGEITLYPTAGFSTFQNYEDDLKLGGWIHLPCDD